MKSFALRLLAAALCLVLLSSQAFADASHFALLGRDLGPCRRLTGSAYVILVFVSTPAHPWTQKQKEAVYDVSWSSLDYIRANAKKYRADLDITYGCLDFSINTEYSRDLAWYWEIIHDEFHAQSIQQVYDYYKQSLQVDEAPILFLFNSWDLSCTYMCKADYPGWNEEFCVIFCDTQMHDHYLTHELYHLYGAIDLYDYSGEGVARIAHKYFGNCDMRCTSADVDDLTAYLIGWTDSLSASAQGFLRETKGLR